MSTEHPYCDDGKVLRDHGEDIVRLEARMDEHSKMVSRLFTHTDELRITATKNGVLIEGISDRLENGITEHLEKKIDGLCKMVTEQRKAIEETNAKVSARILKLEGVSWIPMLIDKGSKRVVAFIIAIVVGVSAVAHTALWALFKSTYFGEKPKMLQTLVNETNRHHVHELEGGGYIVHPPHPEGVEPPMFPVKGGVDNK